MEPRVRLRTLECGEQAGAAGLAELSGPVLHLPERERPWQREQPAGVETTDAHRLRGGSAVDLLRGGGLTIGTRVGPSPLGPEPRLAVKHLVRGRDVRRQRDRRHVLQRRDENRPQRLPGRWCIGDPLGIEVDQRLDRLGRRGERDGIAAAEVFVSERLTRPVQADQQGAERPTPGPIQRRDIVRAAGHGRDPGAILPLGRGDVALPAVAKKEDVRHRLPGQLLHGLPAREFPASLGPLTPRGVEGNQVVSEIGAGQLLD